MRKQNRKAREPQLYIPLHRLLHIWIKKIFPKLEENAVDVISIYSAGDNAVAPADIFRQRSDLGHHSGRQPGLPFRQEDTPLDSSGAPITMGVRRVGWRPQLPGPSDTPPLTRDTSGIRRPLAATGEHRRDPGPW